MVLLGAATPPGTAGRWDAGLFLQQVPAAGGAVGGPVSLVSQHGQGESSTGVHLLPCRTEARRWSPSRRSRLGPPVMRGHPGPEPPPSTHLPPPPQRVPALTWGPRCSSLLQLVGRRQVIPGDDPHGAVELPDPPAVHVVLLGTHSAGTRGQRWDRGHGSGPFGTRICREQPPASHLPPCKPSRPPSPPGPGLGA